MDYDSLQLLLFITARKRSLGQGNIFVPVCHSVHRGTGEYLGRYPPGRYTLIPWQVHPPGQIHPSMQVHPYGQVHPPAGTPPAGTPLQVHPLGQVHPLAGTPPGRYTPGRYTSPAGPPPGRYTRLQVHPLASTPPGRYTPRQVHPPLPAGTPPAGTPPGRYNPRRNACWDTVNRRAVSILLECILALQYFSTPSTPKDSPRVSREEFQSPTSYISQGQ